MKCVRANSSCKCSLRYLNFKLNSEQQKFINTLSKKTYYIKVSQATFNCGQFYAFSCIIF